MTDDLIGLHGKETLAPRWAKSCKRNNADASPAEQAA
ncbi:hypothetical protein J2S68_004109 [Glycomyces algeriensis]|jgi:hypothetical protein|nr:hypothetical protein [Glycomyces algeriensis]